MERLIDDSSRINNLFENMALRNATVTLFFRWRNQDDSEINLVAHVAVCDIQSRRLELCVYDVGETVLQDFFDHYDKKMRMTFIDELNRYLYELEVQTVKSGLNEGSILITTQLPETGLWRQIRRSVRLINRLPDELEADICYVYDISATGVGLLCPLGVQLPADEKLKIEIEIPVVIGDRQYTQTLPLLTAVVRRADYSQNHLLVGLEIKDVDEMSESLIQKYITERRNEFLMHVQNMPGIEVVSITPASV